MQTNNRLLLFLVAVLTVSLAMSGCGIGRGARDAGEPGAGGVSGSPVPGGTLRLALYNDPPDLDIHLPGQRNKHNPLALVHDFLIHRHPETGEMVPGLLTSWDVSEDGLVWSLELREGLKFPSGRKLTAEDLKATWERALDPDFAESYARNRLGPVRHMELVGELRLDVYFDEPFAPFLDALADYVLSPMDVKAVEESGGNYARNPVGAGPYTFAGWDAGSKIRLERNPEYRWPPEFFQNQGAAFPEAVEFAIIPEYGTRLNAFQAGQLDLIEVENVEDIEMLIRDPRYEVVSITTERIASLDFNTAKAPTDDVLVRRAISYGVDRRPLSAIHGPGALISCGPLSPATFGYWREIEDDGICYRHNPERAAELMDAAGWLMADDGYRYKEGKRLEIELGTIQSDAFQRQAQLVQAQLKRLGVDVKITTLEAGAYAAWRVEGNHNLAFNHEIGLDPDQRFSAFHSSVAGIGRNFSHYSNPSMDEMLEVQRRLVNVDERRAMWEDIQRIFIEDAVWLTFSTVPTHIVYNKERIDGFTASAYGELYHDVWIKP